MQVRHDAQDAALGEVRAAVPGEWRRGDVEREDLYRFGFEPGDVVVVVGQDGLVANVAKYVGTQVVVGIDPEPGRNAGVLVTHRPRETADLLRAVVRGTARVQSRAMVSAALDDGSRSTRSTRSSSGTRATSPRGTGSRRRAPSSRSRRRA